MKAILIIFFSALLFLSKTNAQNVGIGTPTPTDAKLEVIATSGNQFVVRNAQTGVGVSSFITTNFPTIGFNGMLTNGYGYMGTGFGSFLQFDPTTGKLSYFASTTGGATANSNMAALTGSLLTIDNAGNFGLGQSTPLEGFHLKNKNIRLDDNNNAKSVILSNTGDAGVNDGGEIKLFSHGNTDSTLILRGSSAAGKGGEIIFVDQSTGTRTMEIDGNYTGSARSRIIVDELQIKGGADFAEYFDISNIADTKPAAGMLVSIDEKNIGKLVISSKAYDKKVVGIISGANGIKPGMMMGHKNTIADGEYPVAISGRVYVMAEALKHPIAPGDLLTTSDIEGYAMKASHNKKAVGAIIGKAMSSLQNGKGMVLVLLSIR
ncbi:MAG: hypothetical protein JSU03_02435 [Bacteroidetes bacterium]|nr:hypothetical protein [Bacteroidota bacterium]MBS1756115.1 hypothetical protein [Bacteroidota bacterium]